MGLLSCDGLLEMGREKNGRSVTWVAEGGREKQGRSAVRGTAQMAVESISSLGDRPLSLSLSLLVRFLFFFFFWKWFKGKLGDGFWTVGRHDLGWPKLG